MKKFVLLYCVVALVNIISIGWDILTFNLLALGINFLAIMVLMYWGMFLRAQHRRKARRKTVRRWAQANGYQYDFFDE